MKITLKEISVIAVDVVVGFVVLVLVFPFSQFSVLNTTGGQTDRHTDEQNP